MRRRQLATFVDDLDRHLVNVLGEGAEQLHRGFQARAVGHAEQADQGAHRAAHGGYQLQHLRVGGLLRPRLQGLVYPAPKYRC